MTQLGTICLLLGLALALYAAVGSVIGARRAIPDLVVSSRRAAYMLVPVTLAASLALIDAFVTHDFAVKYVYQHSDLAMDPKFLWVAFYSGNQGSLLFIALMLSVATTLALYFAPKRLALGIPYTTAILTATVAFFFVVIIFFANPFAPLGFSAQDGLGINPLLSHPAMFIHPPLLMTGLSTIVVPFAYVAGALIAGLTRDEWLDVARVSAIIVWAILGVAMLLGAWWAYTILGWGGYWSWDPIEDAAFMPWLALTAFIHSVMVQKRRGMFRMWNIVLISAAFVLAQLGMFLNRGGPVVSVHSFASSSIGMVFLAFMLLSLAFAFAVFFWRFTDLKSDRPLESMLSREASFLVNNFLLLGIIGFTLWGVVFPLASQFANSNKVTVAAPFFDHINGPMLLGLVFIMGVGPVLPWRRASGTALRHWLIWPTVAGLVTFIALKIAGFSQPIALIAFSVLVFVAASIVQEWYRGTMARRRAGDNWAVGFAKLVAGNRPRHGGYIVHLAILMVAFGVIGTQFYSQRTEVALAPGQSVNFANYRIVYVNSQTQNRSDRKAQWANLDVYRAGSGAYIGRLEPWQAYYPSFSQMSVRAAIRSTPLQDLYIVPNDFLSDGRVALRLSVNPLAMWLWIGGPVLLLGAGIALWPQPALELQTVESIRRQSTGVVRQTEAGI